MAVRLSNEQAEALGLTVPKSTRKPNPHAPYRSRVEKQFAEFGAERVRNGPLQRCDYEPVTLRIGERCTFTPDFRLVLKNGDIQLIEVKGRMADGKPYVRDKAMNKLKAAAVLHPMWAFFLVWPDGSGGWNWRLIGNR
jgi:hypothetical protein